MKLHDRDAPFNSNSSVRDCRSGLASYVWFMKRGSAPVDGCCSLGEGLEDAFVACQSLADEKGFRLNIELAFEVPEEVYVNRSSLVKGLVSVADKLALDQTKMQKFTFVADLDVYPSSFVFFVVAYADDENYPKRSWTYNGSADLLQRVLEINFIQRSRERFIN